MTGEFPNGDDASAVLVGDLMYQFARSGESYVIRASDTFELVSPNAEFPDDASAFNTTPALAQGELYMRSEKSLYCIAKTDD